jgi:hypothetical protein
VSKTRIAGSAICLVAGAVLLFPAPARAYIDPGTGSALLYVVSSIVASLYFALRGLYYKLIELFARVGARDQSCGIAIHCEDPRYEITFLPVVRELAARGLEPTLYAMYPRDESFDPLPSGVRCVSIPPGLVGYSFLNHLEAPVLVTTTPQLDVMTFRRSKRVRHYVHLQHALGESRYVRPYAYDYFDTILCCGPILKHNVRRMEQIRGSRPKQLLETGIPHYEELGRVAREAPQSAAGDVVLVAPSWGPLSMFESFGLEFVSEIARRFRVIVRPHPQMRFSQAELYDRILSLRDVEVDTSRTPASAMSRASVLLSDISGISHEFAFIYERPVVIIDRKAVAGGLEGEVLGGDSELKEACREFIVPVPPEEMTGIVDHLERVLGGHRRERIVEVRDRLVYNFGKAGTVAAEQIAQIYREEKEGLTASTARRSWGLRWRPSTGSTA